MKRRKSSKKRRRQLRSEPELPLPVFDRRALERGLADIGRLLSEQNFETIEQANEFLQQLAASGKIPSAPKLTPLEQAQDLMYEAWEATGKRRAELARQALAISSDCADAYVLLAEETAHSLEEAKDLYEQGVKAGERALGPEAFKEDVGHFWGILETRPYMRARAGLAQCLWLLGEKQQAIAHYTEMLRLNPGDNQGIRYLLLDCLLQVNDDEAVGKLLEQYKDDAMAAWLYPRALWLFRQKGPGKQANAALKKALKQNPYVPDYLIGRRRLPRLKPAFIGWGDENEAIDYATTAIEHWRKTPGALDWLASNLS